MSNTQNKDLLKKFDELNKIIEDLSSISRQIEVQHNDMLESVSDKKTELAKLAKWAGDNIKNEFGLKKKEIEESFAELNDVIERAEITMALLEDLIKKTAGMDERLKRIEDRISALEKQKTDADFDTDEYEIDFEYKGTIEKVYLMHKFLIGGSVPVHRSGWTSNYWFVVEKIENGKAIGKTYNNGTWTTPNSRSATSSGFSLYEKGLELDE